MTSEQIQSRLDTFKNKTERQHHKPHDTLRVLEPVGGWGGGKAAQRSEKFIINSEMGPCDIIRVNKDGDGLPRVLSHELL